MGDAADIPMVIDEDDEEYEVMEEADEAKDEDEDEDEYEVEEILNSRIRKGKLEYQVSWKEYPPDTRFYPASNFENCQKQIHRFHELHPNKKSSANEKEPVREGPTGPKATLAPPPIKQYREPKTLSKQVLDDMEVITIDDDDDE